MLIAVEHLGSVGKGVTGPRFFRANDGNLYVVKLQNNRLGLKVLISEWLAATLGKKMGLCFPPSDIIEINEQTADHSNDLGDALQPGRHFASLYLHGAEYVWKHNIYKAVNTADMAGVLLFDHMFHNADRTNNRKNLLMRQEESGYKMYAIDNSHLFKSGKWTVESLTKIRERIRIYSRYTFGILLRDCLDAQDFVPYLETVAAISDGEIEQWIGAVPEEWLSDAAEQECLIHFIQVRRDMAEKIYHTLLKFIPHERGGRRWF